jgi:hypothetical protein
MWSLWRYGRHVLEPYGNLQRGRARLRPVVGVMSMVGE